jgi:hypothetical protein
MVRLLEPVAPAPPLVLLLSLRRSGVAERKSGQERWSLQ